TPILCFQQLAASFPKTGGVGGPTMVSPGHSSRKYRWKPLTFSQGSGAFRRAVCVPNASTGRRGTTLGWGQALAMVVRDLFRSESSERQIHHLDEQVGVEHAFAPD